MKKVLVPFWLPDEVKSKYKDKVELIHVENPMGVMNFDEITEAVVDVNALVGKANRAIIDAGKNLEAICSFGAGFDAIDIQYAGSKGIKVSNAANGTTEATAELAISVLLCLSRRIRNQSRRLHTLNKCASGGGYFSLSFDDAMPAARVFGKTIGIIGFGKIGKAVAKKAKGLGLKVIYYDVYRSSPEDEERLGATYMTFEEVLKNADYVTLHCLYNQENHHLMNAEAFAMMKEGAFFINTARGPLMDEKALIGALKSKHLGGAALDVYEREPEISPELLSMDEVLLTPHMGTSTYDTRCDMICEVLDNLIAILNGEDIPSIVNRQYLK